MWDYIFGYNVMCVIENVGTMYHINWNNLSKLFKRLLIKVNNNNSFGVVLTRHSNMQSTTLHRTEKKKS